MHDTEKIFYPKYNTLFCNFKMIPELGEFNCKH